MILKFVAGVRIFFRHLKKFWIRYSLGAVVAALSNVFGFFGSAMSFFDISNSEGTALVTGALEKISTAIEADSEKNTQKVLDKIEEESGIDCRDMESLWLPDSSAQIAGQYLVVHDGKRIGSARLIKKFSRVFTLDFIFMPPAFLDTTTTLSLKDDLNNELSFVIRDTKKAALIYKNKGVYLDNENQNEITLSPAIDSGREVKLRIETRWMPEYTVAQAFMQYGPAQKPGHPPTWSKVLEQRLSHEYITDDSVNLNIGLESISDHKELKLKLIECRLSESSRP